MSETKTVVIVARTDMYGGRVCVGALSESGEHLRLMNLNCASDYAQNVPYQIGERWRIDCAHCGEQVAPHLEDAAVSARTRLGHVDDIVSYISERVVPWTGGIDVLFEGKLDFTQNGAGYIAQSAVPAGATGFWVPDVDLLLQHDDRGKVIYCPQNDWRHLSYVGLQTPIGCIQAGQLVRVSLARWWKPRNAAPDFELRCYAQLSGWYTNLSNFTAEALHDELLDYVVNRNFPTELFEIGSKVYIESIGDIEIESVEELDNNFVVSGSTNVETRTDLGEGDSVDGSYPLAFRVICTSAGEILEAQKWELDNSSFFE